MTDKKWQKYTAIIENGEKISSDYINENSFKIELPQLTEIYKSKLKEISSKNYINSYKNKETIKIINPLLLEKEFIGIGDNYSYKFELPEKNRKTEYIYFYKTKNRQKFQKLNIIKYIDSYGIEGHFKIKDGKIVLEQKRVKLDVSKFKIEKLNRFVYGDKNYVYASIDRNIKEIYLNDAEMVEGRDIEINRNKREIYFYNPDFTGILGTGNGTKKEFPLPDKHTNPLIIFVGNEREENFTVKGDKIIFDKPVEYGKKIYYYKYLPEIYFTKELPDYNTGIFIDKEIKAIVINLDKLNYNKNNIILSTMPVIVKGNAKYPVSIISTNDIYLETINNNQGATVSIIGKCVWILVGAGAR